MNEDVFPIENWGDFPVGPVSFCRKCNFFVNGILPPRKSLGGGFPSMFDVHSILGKFSFLAHVFQMGWFNHQPENHWIHFG